ncbi:hypothetical protein V6N13_091716 [Hibiscus sabdariffa]|uniref:TFIIS N-terminal domain-containing protein n=1 Tax=Hibiscus sabdariffa TaxID=183260 RepID=A0ABR2QER4_9ROSI
MEAEKPRKLLRLVIKKPPEPSSNIQHHTNTKKRKLPEVEDAEIKAMFDKIKPRKKMAMALPNPVGTGLLVEKLMALMEVAAEEDVELNSQNQPAIKKMQMLPLLTDFLSKKHLQQEFRDRGVLSLFKIWLEPLPDGSLPNATLRASLLNILTHTFSIDVSSEGGREQLKRSGLRKVIMFLSKSDEETNANRQLAKDLVENWSRIIFNKSEWYSDLGITQEKVVMPTKKVKESAMQVREADLDLKSRPPKQSYTSAASGTRQGTVSVPKPSPFVYAVNPRSNYNPEIARGGSRYEKPRERIEKNMRMLKNSKRKPLQPTKLSVNGRSCFAI